MNRMYMRFSSAGRIGVGIAVFIAVILLYIPCVAQTPPSPVASTQTIQSKSTPLEEFLANPSVNKEGTSVYLADIRSGKVLVQHNASLPLVGASTMKLVTIASLLHTKPVNYKFATRVETAGRIVDGELQGNLHIIGSGDPTLNTDRTPKTPDFVAEVVAALKKRGMKSIAGNVLIDQSVFTLPAQPSTWHQSDCNTDYGAGSFGFNFQRNHNGSRSVSNPAGVFLGQLEKALSTAGITLEKRNFTGGGRRNILTHYSAPLDEIMRSCMMRSDNMYAESLLRLMALSKEKPGSTEAGATEVMSLWNNLKAPMQGVKIYDGSGLSRSDRLTALFLAHVLKTSSHDPYFSSFFPLAGVEGTLSSFLKGTRLEAYVAMKTGSMHDIQAYAGYKLDDNYIPTHVVVILANNFKGSRDSYRKAVEKLLLSYL